MSPASETGQERVTRLIPGKQYLGDGAYVQSAGWGTAIDLTAENGIEITHRIQLEPNAWLALQAYMRALEAGVNALEAERQDEDEA